MKRRVLSLLAFIFLMSFACAAEFDNIKSDISISNGLVNVGDIGVPYNSIWEKYGPVKIENAFGLGDTLFEGALTTHTTNCGSQCTSIATSYLGQDSPLIEDVRFYEISRDGEYKLIDFKDYKIYIQDGTNILSDYSEVCFEDGLNLNGSIKLSCSIKEVGSHEEPVWVEYNIGDIVQAGNYKWKIEGNKDPNIAIDWQIKTQGKWIEEWGVWDVSNLATGVRAYYKFDEGTGTLADDAAGNKDINLANSWAGGIINNSFKTNDAAFNFTTINASGSSSLTVNLWINETGDIADYRAIFHVGDTTSLNENGEMFVRDDADTPDQDWIFSIRDNVGIKSIDTGVIVPGKWTMLTFIANESRATIYYNGVQNATVLLSAFVPSTNYNYNLFSTSDGILSNALIDEMGFWNRSLNGSEVSQLYNSGTGMQYPFSSSITLNSPVNGYNSSSRTIFHNISAMVISSSISNISIYCNATGTFTYCNSTSLTGTSNNTVIAVTYPSDGNYIWNAQSCAANGDCGFSNPNRTYTIDTTSPSVTIYYPAGTINGLSNGQTLGLNFTATDLHLATCMREYNGVNTTINCNANTTFAYANGVNTIAVYANDTFGNFVRVSSSWSQDIIISSVSYNNITYETSHENFILNFSSPGLLSATGIFTYNGTNYTSSVSCASGNCSALNSLDIPIINSGTQQNNTFYWVITAFNGTGSSLISSQTYTQTVNQLTLSYCTLGQVALNFTSYDEQNKTRIRPFNFEGTFNYYRGLGGIYKNLSISNSSSAEIDICADQNTTYQVNAIIAYSAPNASVAYTTRNYFYQNYSINTTTKAVPLYLLRSAVSTSFILQVQDRFLQPVPNVLVNVQKCYPGMNSIETAFISRTDSNGLTVGNFEAETALYQFLITNYSQTLLAVTPCSKVVPQTAPYTLLFQLGSGYVSPFTGIVNVTNFNGSLFFNYSSNIATFVYEDTSGNFTSSQLYVYSMNYSGLNQPLVCQSSSNLSAGILTCNVSVGGTYFAQAFIYRTTEVLSDQITFIVETFSSTVGYYGAFLGFFIILICAFAFKFNEIAGIWLVNFGVIVCNWIGLIAFGKVFITAMLCVSIIITAVIER